ncbi:MAG: triose-phosphate isomerase, partial [bacterium]|nr:triose-phosphate isomerase [bacterium]
LKMNLTLPQALDYEKQLAQIETKQKLIICPSFPYLDNFRSKNYELGSQNVSSVEGGALTGEVSAEQLKSLNVKYTIVGHYERRKFLKETKAEICDKIKLLQKNDIIPILCIGEESNQFPEFLAYLKEELSVILKDISMDSEMIIAYEPAWAIGTGMTPTTLEIKEVVTNIKHFIKEYYKKEVKVVYGGSVNIENIKDFKEITELDGFLLGGTSLNISNLKEIIRELEV